MYEYKTWYVLNLATTVPGLWAFKRKIWKCKIMGGMDDSVQIANGSRLFLAKGIKPRTVSLFSKWYH